MQIVIVGFLFVKCEFVFVCEMFLFVKWHILMVRMCHFGDFGAPDEHD